MKYPVRNRKIKHSKLIAFWASVLAVASVSSIGFAAWASNTNASADTSNVSVEVGNLNNVSIITLDSYSIFKTAIVGSERLFYNSDTGALSTTGTLTVNLTFHSAFVAGSESTININGYLFMDEKPIPGDTELPNWSGCTSVNNFYPDPTLGKATFTITFTKEEGVSDINFSLSFTFKQTLLNLELEPKFSLDFEVASEVAS